MKQSRIANVWMPVTSLPIWLTIWALIGIGLLPAHASGIPPCQDDKCTAEKTELFREILIPLTKITSPATDNPILKLLEARGGKQINTDSSGTVEGILSKWGVKRWTLSSTGQTLRLQFDIALVCIDRADVERNFRESWYVSRTPARWEKTLGTPGVPHGGSMNFRLDQAYRFGFGFVPSGCADELYIFLG